MSDAKSVEARMSDAVEAMDKDFNHIRTGRASTSLVERIVVDYYGTQTPLNQLASISVPESTTLVIQPWDRGVLGAVEKAIQKSDVGITPNNDGKVVRISIPPLTEERRREMVKLLHKYAEEGRVAVRHARHKAKADIEHHMRDGELGEDDYDEEDLRLLRVKFLSDHAN